MDRREAIKLIAFVWLALASPPLLMWAFYEYELRNCRAQHRAEEHALINEYEASHGRPPIDP